VSTTSHQRDNAIWMAKQSDAMHLPQSELTPEKMATLLQTLSRATCEKMADAAYAAGQRNANEAIAAILEELAGKTGTPA
jgi:UDP-N-acetylglucosamine--N-acetylmuramyl-(pentapeptide) pyrophosphoryl-undecaprenol N-acetylglucosamine transferase